MEVSALERRLAIRLAAMDLLAAFETEASFRYEQLSAFRFD